MADNNQYGKWTNEERQRVAENSQKRGTSLSEGMTNLMTGLGLKKPAAQDSEYVTPVSKPKKTY